MFMTAFASDNATKFYDKMEDEMKLIQSREFLPTKEQALTLFGKQDSRINDALTNNIVVLHVAGDNTISCTGKIIDKLELSEKFYYISGSTEKAVQDWKNVFDNWKPDA